MKNISIPPPEQDIDQTNPDADGWTDAYAPKITPKGMTKLSSAQVGSIKNEDRLKVLEHFF
jgi:hypothetical protein